MPIPRWKFPDRQNFRVYLEDLRNEEVCERLRKIWLDPQSLDPAQASAKVIHNVNLIIDPVAREYSPRIGDLILIS
jgi:hypothetical protein